MKDSTPIQNKGRFKKIILIEDTPAYFLDAKSNLVKKGEFKKGRILKVDSETIQKEPTEGSLFKVESVRHRNIFIPVNKSNADYLTMQHIKDLAIEKMKAYGKGEKEIFENLGEETKAMESFINEGLDGEPHNSDTLSLYYEGAFSNADGFDFAGEFDELFEQEKKEDTPKPDEIIEAQIKESAPISETGDDQIDLNMVALPRTEGRAFRE